MKKRILFVDDEANVLQGLQRMLRGLRDCWDMQFASSGEEALTLLDKEIYDVLVTDMRMPGMDGAQLLTEVKRRHPRMIRIVLSGQVEMETMLRSVDLTHQFIAKPCDAEALRSVITRSTALHDLLENETIKQMVSSLKSLPSLPSLYLEIMQELKSENSSMARVGKIISTDIGMSAKILQLVNSAFFGLPRQVSNPSQAAIYLGMDTIRALVLSVNIFSQFSDRELNDLGLRGLWKHSMIISAAAREIAALENCAQNVIDFSLTAGLLHDVGKLVLASNLPSEYAQVLKYATDMGINAEAAEREILSITHAEIGAYLLGLWGLQDPLVEAVCFHHYPSHAPHSAFSPLTVIHVANALYYERKDPVAGNRNKLDPQYLEAIGKSDRLIAWRKTFSEILQRGESND